MTNQKEKFVKVPKELLNDFPKISRDYNVDIGTIEGLYGKEWFDIEWAETRQCMLAGTSGGHGYFGEGWQDKENCLIVDPPEALRFLDANVNRIVLSPNFTEDEES